MKKIRFLKKIQPSHVSRQTFDSRLPKRILVRFHTQKWFDKLSEETEGHRSYLASIGLSDRADYFKVNKFIYRDTNMSSIDISRFSTQMTIPEEVKIFDPQKKNTIFMPKEAGQSESRHRLPRPMKSVGVAMTERVTMIEHATGINDEQEQEIKRLLDIRLYPTIKRFIHEFETIVFLGLVTELQAFTKSRNEKICAEIEIPSSVKFYIATNAMGRCKVYIAGLVSHENLIQQLITLKLANINLNKITILGNTDQFKSMCLDDLRNFKKQSSSYIEKKNALIVAGCHLEDKACASLNEIFRDQCTLHKFFGNIVSLTYATSKHAPGLGFIVLNLNYGEICEKQIEIILENFNCIGVFTGSAAGYIRSDKSKDLPAIGERLSITTSRHHLGDTVSLNEITGPLHLQVPSIFVETFEWLEKAKKMGATTVDVETFYIVRAIANYIKQNPEVRIHTDIGVFISDFVGEKQLRSYQHVFDKYTEALNAFIQKIILQSLISNYQNNKNSTPHFEKGYLGLKPSIIPIDPRVKKEAVVESIGKQWDVQEFFKRVHTPVRIGKVTNQDKFTNTPVSRCIHLPIKLPGSDIRIPKEYEHFLEILKDIFNFEVSVNSKWNDLYAYLTIDQGYVPKYNSQRVPGPHVDGIPQDRNNPNSQIIDHAYLVTNAIPTMFYIQKFDMQKYDLHKHNFFAIFRALGDESRTITVKPFEIFLMDAYSVHTPTQTKEDVFRTFVRLEFSYLEFNRQGNSINPYFASDSHYPNYPFRYRPKPIDGNLYVPASVYEDKPISNKEFMNESIDDFGRAQLRAVFMNDERYKQNRTGYKDLNKIANEIMEAEVSGIVITKHGVPHAFYLYKVVNERIQMHTLFTLSVGMGQEALLYGMILLKKLSNKLHGKDAPLQISINDNNKDMLIFFLRASELANVPVELEYIDNKPVAIQDRIIF